MTKLDLRAWLVSALALAAGAAAVYDGTRGMGPDAPCGTSSEGRERRRGAARGRAALARVFEHVLSRLRANEAGARGRRAGMRRGGRSRRRRSRERLAARYEVSALPTFLTIDANGREVTRLVGVQSRDVIERAVEAVRGVRCAAR